MVRRLEQPDRLGRPDVAWTAWCLRLPDDGAGALPLLRGMILNDDKSSTYKLGLRLAPDMFALAHQVQVASDTAKGCVARLTGLQPPSYPDTEATLPELKERIDGREDKPVTIRLQDRPLIFSGRDYLLRFALPNFFFDLRTAYDILREQGVPLGKPDFLGELPASSAASGEARPA